MNCVCRHTVAHDAAPKEEEEEEEEEEGLARGLQRGRIGDLGTHLPF